MTLVDTNVLLDIVSKDAIWFEWSVKRLAMRAAVGPVLVNETIYAELSARMETASEVEGTLTGFEIHLERTVRSALFLAGKVFRQYRAAGGIRTGVLPDFFIGAHAQVMSYPILTRDLRRYRTYFPTVELIAPDG